MNTDVFKDTAQQFCQFVLLAGIRISAVPVVRSQSSDTEERDRNILSVAVIGHKLVQLKSRTPTRMIRSGCGKMSILEWPYLV